MRLAIISVIALALTGCAAGKRIDYMSGTPEFVVRGARSVAVATQDTRPYVVSGEKTPTYVGIKRGPFGEPFGVTTASRKPLADDFSATIARALTQKGFKVTAVSVTASQTLADARVLIARAGADRLALVSIMEWKSDTPPGNYLGNTVLFYDLALRVYDASGTELAANQITGNDKLSTPSEEGDMFLPRGAIRTVYKRKLEELFASDAVAKSLQ